MVKCLLKGFEGWSLKVWIVRNLKLVKEVAKVVIPGLVGWLTTYNPVLGFFAAGLGKIGLDTLEYWVKRQLKK